MLVPLQDRARLLRMATKPPLRYRPTASFDDGYAWADTWDAADPTNGIMNGNLNVGDWHGVGGFSYRTGLRCVNPTGGGVQVTKGEHIRMAKLRFYGISVNYPNYNVLIRSEPSDNAVAFANYADVWHRTRGTASLLWNDSSQWHWRWTPDIAAVVQEVTDRPGWVKGNALVVFLDATAASARPSGFNADGRNTAPGPEKESAPWLYIWL